MKMNQKMHSTTTRIITGALAFVTVTAHAAEPLSVSGIYPHLTVFNSDHTRERPEPECGLGAAVPWAGKLWSTTYADGQWNEYQRLMVQPGQTRAYDFPVGYAAHWLRVRTSADCTATALCRYE